MDCYEIEKIRVRMEFVKKRYLKNKDSDLHLLLLHDIPKLLEYVTLDKMKRLSNGDKLDG